MKKFLLAFIASTAVGIAAYIYWSHNDRVTSVSDIYPRYVLSDVESYGTNTGKGNLLALSPYVHTYDFSSGSAFYNMLEYYLSFAQRKNLLNDSTVLVLPEYLGTWLVAAHEQTAVYKDTSITVAMQRMVLSNIWSFGKAYLNAQGSDKTKDAVFRMKAIQMRSIYQTTFSKLAKQFKITIVAGSILLPEPKVKNGSITIDLRGRLYNVTAVFNKEGIVLPPLTRKAAPISTELPFTACAEVADLPVYTTPAGRLGVLICADAWYPKHYTILEKKGATMLAVPSFVSGKENWNTVWCGYDGGLVPADVDKNDIGNITEQDAWLKYAMTGRIKNTGLRHGVNVFLRGDLWNLGSDGRTLIWNNGTPVIVNPLQAKTGSLINVWL